MKKSMFVLLLVCGLLLSVPAQGEVTLTPSNVELPTAAGEDLSFDFLTNDPCGFQSTGFQSTITYSGPGTLTFDPISSKTVTGEANYWIPGSLNVAAFETGNNYVFGDGMANSTALADNAIIARYVFEWDGTIGDYTFTIDLNTSNSFFQDEFFEIVGLDFDPGLYPGPGGSDSFTLTLVPEPATLVLLGLGGFMLRKRRA